MAICKHCNGTGEAPKTLTLECVSCQKPVKVTYNSIDDLIDKALNVHCRGCKIDLGITKEVKNVE